MDEQTNQVNDLMRLLDNGAYVVIYRNGLGSYTSVALRGDNAKRVQHAVNKTADDGPHITDDFTPAKSLYRLAEKQLGNIVGMPNKAE